MDHFSSERWIDFTRGTGTKEQRAELQGHLDDGCPECVASQQLWQSVAEATKREPAYAPPADIVEVAKRFLLPHPPPPAPGLLTGLLSKLVFDSFLEPSLAGVRGSAASVSPRQLVYEAAGLAITLQQQPPEAGSSLPLVGQVLSQTPPQPAPGSIRVRALRGPVELASTLAGNFGEFELPLESYTGVQLEITAPGIEAIWLTLPN